jgi:preprotein translocase subunit YajC
MQVKYENKKIGIEHLKKGTKIITGGGNIGVITGHKTRNEVQIKLDKNGEFDWISKLAVVEQI